jgi:hypothetical protein
MAVSSFEEMCAGFCELIAVSPPVLRADANGLVAFHVVLRNATVILAHRPATSKDHFFVLFELGPISGQAESAATEMQALLEANFVLLQVNAPVFSRNPATGDAVLQYVFPLFDTTVTGLYELIDKEIDRLFRWRENLLQIEANDQSADSRTPHPPDIFFQIA